MIKIHIKNINILMTEIYKCGRFKYGCRVQIWKKKIVKIVKSLITVLFKMTSGQQLYQKETPVVFPRILQNF